ncbi:MAG: phosphoenolpyruvate carboxykinase (ATP) [Deltaproteobacteria bacterium]|nr:phosphoenolpyruvate carboxykinase (ATP) [Deltaproteobacteria bacterium]MBW2072904.1 phosphoenolpyruvate carboxykinase (ATP) [Deltaproteobacteria bacterium]
MSHQGRPSYKGLEDLGLENLSYIYWNLTTSRLYEQAVRRREGLIAHLGPLVVRTGHYTGRAPKDKFIVREPSSEDKIWWGDVNVPFEEDKFERLFHRLLAYLQGKDVYVQDCYAGADPRYRVPIRVVTETAWHSIFARNMFIRITDRALLDSHRPRFHIICTPQFHAVPDLDGTRSGAFIVVHFGKGLVLIGGTSYAGEIKKSVFTIMNYLLPQERVLSMHCSANVGDRGDVAVFFGLSGTGKTTLSAAPGRRLIGDDEHGWSDNGVFNFEGGCYAKVIRLSAEAEPDIYECTRRFGTVLENVAIDPITRRIDLDDDSLTENTRAAYPISHIANAELSGVGGHPKNIVMLTCDAFGVLPPVSKLTPAQAMAHFLLGYTAKVAGTEKGITEPQATFSACFGAPFMALPPTVYASLLKEKISEHQVNCWLVNTGWTGGTYGVGERMSIAHTRRLVEAAIEGALDEVPFEQEPHFGLHIPRNCPGVPDEVLKPKNTWADSAAYDAKASELAAMFGKEFEPFANKVTTEVREAIGRL